MARRKLEAARLQQAARLARDCGVAPPERYANGVPMGRRSLSGLTPETIPTEYLEELCELLLEAEGEDGGDDGGSGKGGGGEGGGEDDADEEQQQDGGSSSEDGAKRKERRWRPRRPAPAPWPRRAATWLHEALAQCFRGAQHAMRRCCGGAAEDIDSGDSPARGGHHQSRRRLTEEEKRAQDIQALLRWCKQRSELLAGVPRLVWDEVRIRMRGDFIRFCFRFRPCWQLPAPLSSLAHRLLPGGRHASDAFICRRGQNWWR